MKFVSVSFAVWMLCTVSSCSSEASLPVVADPTVRTESSPTPGLEFVDLTKVPRLDKGRFQKGGTATGEPNHVAKVLVANGKNSIPFLISKLDDETKLESPAVNFWYEMYVGDVALIILGDLFTDETGINSTVPGFGWDDFLERGDDKTMMGEEVLRRYIRKNGRGTIKQRWQKMWDQNKQKIFWDEKCYCFKIRNS